MDLEGNGLSRGNSRNVKKIANEFGFRKNLKLHVSEIFDDYSDYDILNNHLQYAYTSYMHKYASKNIDFEDLLYYIGLKKYMAKIYFNVIYKLLDTCYSDEQLLEIIAEFAIASGNSKTKSMPFLYNVKVINQWYKMNGIQYVNIEDVVNVDNLIMTLKQNIDFKNTHQLLFHATSWDSSENIIKNGVKHEFGRECLDFGMVRSFYLTPNIDIAIEWCEKSSERWRNECCIIVFSIPISRPIKQKNKIFNTSNAEWQKNVKESRQCKKYTVQYLDNFDFVYGPMCSNVRQVKNLNHVPIAYFPVKNQLACKSTIADKYVTQGIVACFIMESRQ